MNNLRQIPTAVAAVLAALLTGCETGGDNQHAGISGTGQQLGSVNGFGSVIVNGVRYDTTAADIYIDGQPAPESDLSIGMVVLVDGTIESEYDGTANRIDFNRTLCAPVESVDQENGSFVAGGITIDTDEATQFINTTMSSLAVTTTVKVSGYHGFGGQIAAGYVEATECTTAPRIDVEGFVEDLDAPGRTFSIGTLTVEYSRAVVNEENGALAEGSIVEVIGNRTGSGADLIATQINVFSSESGEPGKDINVEGIVNNYVSDTNFRVGTQIASIQGATKKDLSGKNVQDGARVHLQGSIDENGVLVAHRYYVIPENNYRMTGPLGFIGDGTFQYGLLGDPRFYLPLTSFTDSSAAANPSYGPADLTTGDWIVITGYRGISSDRIVAATLERIDPGDATSRGPVDSLDLENEQIVIAATNIHTDCGNTTVCYDRNGNPTTTELFYGDLNVNDVLDVVGSENARDIVASEIRHH